MDLTTVEKVKSFLGVSGTSGDTAISMIVSGISSEISAYCGREFNEEERTEVFDCSLGDRKLFLREFPVSSLASLKYRSGTWASIQWLDFNANDYMLRADKGVIDMAYSLPEALAYVQAVYTGGYKIDFDNEDNPLLHTLPADISLAATQMAAEEFQLRQSQGILSESTEGQSVSYKQSSRSKSETMQKLSKYRSFRV